MEYKNNWPTCILGKVARVKSEVGGSSLSGVCVGAAKKQAEIDKLDVALARAETNRKKKVENSALPIDALMSKLVYLQRSSDLNRACMARKAAAELAGERKRLAFMCNVLNKNSQDVRTVMAVENRKALALFRSRWANLLGGV